MHKHASWLARRPGCLAKLLVIEKMEATFEQLHRNCHEQMNFDKPPSLDIGLLNTDAREWRLPPWIGNQAAFIHCDPNKVSDMPLTEQMLRSWNKWTTYLVTLGCNVAGLKRLDPEFREPWFGYVDAITSRLPKHHDAILYWLIKDDAQWAYLLSVPQKWADRYRFEIPQGMAKLWTKGTGCASFRSERKAFDTQLRKLFLTREEFNATR